jgi:hypothetical protein
VRLCFVENLGFKKAPHSIDRGHPDRKTLKLKVFDDAGVLIVLLSSPLKEKNSDSVDTNQVSTEEEPGIM